MDSFLHQDAAQEGPLEGCETSRYEDQAVGENCRAPGLSRFTQDSVLHVAAQEGPMLRGVNRSSVDAPQGGSLIRPGINRWHWWGQGSWLINGPTGFLVKNSIGSSVGYKNSSCAVVTLVRRQWIFAELRLAGIRLRISISGRVRIVQFIHILG